MNYFSETGSDVKICSWTLLFLEAKTRHSNAYKKDRRDSNTECDTSIEAENNNLSNGIYHVSLWRHLWRHQDIFL